MSKENTKVCFISKRVLSEDQVAELDGRTIEKKFLKDYEKRSKKNG